VSEPEKPRSGYPEWDDEGLSRLPTRFEVAGILFSRFLRKLALAVALLVVVTAVVVLVPANAAGKSDAYRLACEFVTTQRAVWVDLGAVLGCESSPTQYRLGESDAAFTFVVYGDGTEGAANVILRRNKQGSWEVNAATFLRSGRGVNVPRLLRRSDTAPIGSR
jgi:hypothetical protein